MIRSASQIRTPYAWLTPTILLVAVVVFTISAISIDYMEDQFIAKTGESLAVAAADIAKMADRILFERYSDTPMLSRVAVFRRHDQSAMTEYLAALKKTYPVYVWLGVTDEKGRILAATNPADVGKDQSGREWFQSARDRGGIQVQDASITEDSGGIHVVAFTAPARGTRDEFLGVVMTCVSLPALVDLSVGTIHAMMVQQGSSARIEYQFLTRDGDLIADSLLHEEGKVNLKRLALRSALFSGSAQPGYVEEQHLRRHVPVITGYAQTEGYGEFTGLHWTILVRMDRSDILAPIRTNLRKLGLAEALVFVPLLGFLLWTTGRLKRQWARAHLRERAIAAAENSIFITDPTQRDNPIIYVNPAFERLTGYASEEILGRSYRFLEKPDTDQAAVEEIRQALREERECRVVAQNYRRDGTPFWNEMTISPVRDTTGKLTHYVWVLTDITERKQAEEALRESEERFRSLIEAIPQQVWTAQPDGALDYVNQRVVEYFGRTFEQMIGWGWQDVLHPDDLPECLARWSRARETGEPYEIEFRLRRGSDGTYRWHIGRALPLCDKEGRIVKWFGTNTDITELKQAEQSLRESEERYKHLVNHATDIIYRADASGRFTFFNPTAIRIMKYSEEYLAGRHYLDLIRPDYRAAAEKFYGLQFVRKTPSTYYEFPAIAGDGTVVWLGQNVQLIFEKDRIAGFQAVARDITERKRAEETLEGLRRQNELILNSAGEGIYGLDLQGNATFVNPAAARMLGWEVEDLIGKPMHPTLHHSKHDGTPYPEEACPIYAAFKYGTIQYVDDEVFWKKDGTSLSVEYISTPLREQSVMVGAVVTFQDITERKRAQEALQAERDHSGMIIRNTPAIVCGIAPDGTTTFVNPAGQRLTGYSTDELVGRNWWRTFYPGDEYRQVEQLFRDFQKGDVRDYEMVLTTRSGEKRTVSWNSINRFDEAGQLIEIIGFGNDVTERKREAEIRALLLEEVITAQEEERRRIARELHDETGQSLTALLVGLRAMEEARTIKEAQLHARELRRIAALTLDEVGRLARGLHPSALDDLGLAAALERYAAEFEESHRIKVAVHTRSMGSKRLPRPVETALYRIVQEALTNIAKHAGAKTADICVESHPSFVCATVKDDGRGFDVDLTRQPPGASRHLGIHGMQERAVRLKGALTIESMPWGGTTISVRIPLTENSHD